jgi:hypothetical protein
MSHPLAIIEYQQTCWYQITKQSPRNRQKDIMSNITIPTVGSQFTTQKSGVSGIVQEVVANKNGSFRVRLEVAGADRWSTIK